jgi:DNA-binding response OmpR family regulator
METERQGGDDAYFRARILMVSEDVGDIVREHMESNGFRFANLDARNASDILDELARRHYDLVVLTNNGFPPEKIAGAIGSILASFPNLRVFVASGWKDDAVARLWLSSGADRVLPLPFRMLDFVDEINCVVRPRQ